MEVDVAIIGAGPAGSTLAALLAGRGLRVALVDRDLFPRDKLCGEFLSYDALPLLEPLGVVEALDAAGAPRIESCRVIGSRRTYELALPRAARGVSRLFFDALLLRKAEERGAIRLDGWTASALSLDGVTIERDGERRRLKAAAIVGAWGRWGRFDQFLGRRFVRDRSHRSFGFKRHYRSPLPQQTIDLHSFPRGYLGVNAVEGGITNICGLVHAARLAGHRGRWDGFVETIRRERPDIDALYAAQTPAQEGYLSSEPVIFRPRSAVEEGVFMIGDASGVIDPLTGNGMAMAIQSAYLAAPEIVRHVAGDSSAADDYRERHARFFGRRIFWSRRVASLLSRPRLLDAGLTVVRNRRLGEGLLRSTRAADDSAETLAEAWFR